MRRAAWCAGVGGGEAFCRVFGRVLWRRATSERGGLGAVGVGVVGVGERAGLNGGGEKGRGVRVIGTTAAPS